MILLLSTSGCLVKERLIRSSLSPIPENLNNVLYVAQEKKIKIGVEGTDKVFTKDVCGYYLIHKEDLKIIMKKIEND